jgi:hypothetical protein
MNIHEIYDRLADEMHLPHLDPETPVTTTAPAEPAASFARTISQAIHKDAQYARTVLSSLGSVVGHLLPLAERIATDPKLDAFLEAGLRASDLGVEEAVFDGAIDMMRAAAERKQPATQAMPAVRPVDTSGVSVDGHPFGPQAAPDSDWGDAKPAPSAPAPSGTPAEAPVAPESASQAVTLVRTPVTAFPSLSGPQAVSVPVVPPTDMKPAGATDGAQSAPGGKA